MFFYVFLNDFLMGSKGFGKVPASKWCKMQQYQWFSLVFQGFTKQNDGIPGVFASFGEKKHRFYIKKCFFYDCFVFFLWFFDGFQGFWQGSSLQVVQKKKT